LLPKASLARLLALAGRSLRTGAAGFGLSLALFSDDVGNRLALLLVAVLAALGWLISRRQAWATAVSLGVAVLLIALARAEGGLAGALAMSALAGSAMWLRLDFRAYALGLAIFGAAVALLTQASLHLVLAFWSAGWLIETVRMVLADRRLVVKTENPALAVLRSDR
jgi:hypothetical protein